MNTPTNEVRILTDEVLRTKAQEIREVTSEERALAERMVKIMHAHNGVGLAANQIGVLKRMIVVNPYFEKGKEVVLLNPHLVLLKKRCTDTEGCLSVPGIAAEVSRAYRVEVEALNLEGKKVRFTAEDLFARILQHETDHLDGILFIDRLSLAGRFKIRAKLKTLLRGAKPRRSKKQ